MTEVSNTGRADDSPLRDAFVRYVEPDGTIQIGHADPEGEYGVRPVEIVRISQTTGYNLASALVQALSGDARYRA